jgi:signal peptide peptidase SppA, 36K type
MSFYNTLKNVFFLLLFLSIAPSLFENIRMQYGRYVTPKTQVAVLPIKGILCDSTSYNKYLHQYFENPSIKAILLKVECPGSAAGTGQAIYNEIKMLKKDYPKPVVVLIENVCASGGYYIAASADHIIAPGTAMIGSIGVTLPYLFQLRDFIEEYKIHYASIKAGSYKNIGNPFENLTSAERTLLQGVLDDTYQQFADDVAKSRKLSIKELNVWADGKVFSGRQAMQLGLIDEVGSAYNAVKAIKEMALIEGDIEWIKPPTQISAWSLITGSEQDNESSMLTALSDKVCANLESKLLGNRIY